MNSNRVQRVAAGRIQRHRVRLGMSQADLAGAMGFASRQTLSQVERLERPVSASELTAAAAALGCPVGDLLDTMRLDADCRWSCRASDAKIEGVASFRDDAERLVGLLFSLRSAREAGLSPLRRRLHLTERSHDGAVEAAAESVWCTLGRPATPAVWLEELVAEHGMLDVIDLDTPTGVLAGLVLLPELQVAVVNRQLDRVARADVIAQALFRALTWPVMTPPELERSETVRGKGARGSRMAARFAATLLLPAAALLASWSECESDGSDAERCLRLAERFRVSPAVLGGRLVAIDVITPGACRSMLRQVEGVLAGASPTSTEVTPPLAMPLFGGAFLREVSVAIEAGRLSVRRAASLLRVDLSTLGERCRDVGAPLLSYDFS